MTEQQIEHQAEQWAIDYKPWDESLDYREYAEWGYKEGMKAALSLLTDLDKHTISDALDFRVRAYKNAPDMSKSGHDWVKRFEESCKEIKKKLEID